MASMNEVCGFLVEGILPMALQADLIRDAAMGCTRVHVAMQHALRNGATRTMRRLEREASIIVPEAMVTS